MNCQWIYNCDKKTFNLVFIAQNPCAPPQTCSSWILRSLIYAWCWRCQCFCTTRTIKEWREVTSPARFMRSLVVFLALADQQLMRQLVRIVLSLNFLSIFLLLAYDRFKTISSPMDGKMNKGQVLAIIVLTWLWAAPFTILPALKVWSRFVPEGFLTTCSFDFLTDNDDTRVFVACIFVWAYCIPMFCIAIFYSKLFKHVKAHEKMLKEQAKKMNVASLVSNKDQAAQSVEIRIAKACFTIFFLFVCAWTPYAVVALIGAFGNRSLLTPLTTMIPAVAAKIVSCIDPWWAKYIFLFTLHLTEYLLLSTGCTPFPIHATDQLLKRKCHGLASKNQTVTQNQQQLLQLQLQKPKLVIDPRIQKDCDWITKHFHDWSQGS